MRAHPSCNTPCNFYIVFRCKLNTFCIMFCVNKLADFNVVSIAVTSAATTSAATFLVAQGLEPQLFKNDRAASILTTFKRCANRKFYFLTKYFFETAIKHGLVKHLYETGIKHVQPLLQLLGIFPSYSLSFVKICI